MCLISIFQSGKAVTAQQYDLLRLASLENPHGWGISWVHNGRLVVKKGLDGAKGIEELLLAPVDSPRIIHFRYATNGSVDVKNAHPFVVRNTAVFHNGVFKPFAKDKKVSDSRLLAKKLVAPLVASLQGTPSLLKDSLDALCGWNNRLALLFPKENKVIVAGIWFEYAGMILSNTYSFPGILPKSMSELSPQEALGMIKSNPKMYLSLVANG